MGFLTDEQYDAVQSNYKHPWLHALLTVAYTFDCGNPNRWTCEFSKWT